MIAPCFVDANVLVYGRDVHDVRRREIATTLLDRLWVEQSGRTSVQALNEFYNAATRKLKQPVPPEEAWADVEMLFAWNPQAVDAEVMNRARSLEKRFRLSWWDALIVAAAQLQGCRILYSEDLQHGAMFDGLQVRNPFLDQVNELPPPDYAAEARRSAPHRPRGRPRKLA